MFVFDCPSFDGDFEERMEHLRKSLKNCKHAIAIGMKKMESSDQVKKILLDIENLGGEGLMLRKPHSSYHQGRTNDLLKVKSFTDTEALVVDYEYRKGTKLVRHLECRLPNGIRFSVGGGLSNEERANPPKKGAVISFKYQELSESGKPRFPSYLRERKDVTWDDVCKQQKEDRKLPKANAKLKTQHTLLFSDLEKLMNKPHIPDDEDEELPVAKNEKVEKKTDDKKKEKSMQIWTRMF